MKIDDKVCVAMTGRQMAKAYAVLGRSNGSGQAEIWSELKSYLDPKQEKYNLFIDCMHKLDTLNYNSYEDKWLELLFSDGKSEEQKQLDELMLKIEQLNKEANKLKEMIESK